ncbi:MAG: tyrosine-protein phosphatase [Alphaproteobacteria bacterium]|jgi:protein tyrosine/serine phosphatase|nr:tyrosine-protein phosphatase [Alphaproteobacteria bacterium]
MRAVLEIPRLEGVDNFRDYGGYAVADGRRVRRGVLLRSANHHGATDADLEALAGLDLALVVDLRRRVERERAPSRRPEGFAAAVISSDEDRPDSWLEHVQTSDLSPGSFHDFLVGYYRDAVFEPCHHDLFARYFASLEEIKGPVLIHCAAGKDRTGILAALTHRLLGVAEDDLMQDYLATNQAARIEMRTPLMAAYIRDLTGRTPTDAALRVCLGVHADYLEAAFAAIEARMSLEAYFAEVLGVGPQRCEAIAARLLNA